MVHWWPVIISVGIPVVGMALLGLGVLAWRGIAKWLAGRIHE